MIPASPSNPPAAAISEYDHAALSALLIQQRECTAQLLAVLEQESHAILNRDVTTLQRVGKDKEQCCEDISAMERSWPAVLRREDAPLWIRLQDTSVSNAWHELIEQLRLCRRKNDANGLLIADQQQRITARMQPKAEMTYGAGGQHTRTQAAAWVASA